MSSGESYRESVFHVVSSGDEAFDINRISWKEGNIGLCLIYIYILISLQVNQIGSVTESIQACLDSQKAGWGVMVSHR